MSHSRLAVEQQETVAESSESLQSLNVPAQSASHALPKNSDYGERDKMSEQAISSADQNDLLDGSKFVEGNSETTPTKDDHKGHLVNGVAEAGSKCTDVSQTTHGKQQDPAIPPEINWGDDGQTATSGPDILIDINDRFPRDFLSDIFTKAILSEESSNLDSLQQDGAGLSMNIEYHDPKNWSFFQKLAKDDFQKDASLIDQDHAVYSSGLSKIDAEVPGVYQLAEHGIPPSHADSHNFGEYSQSQRESPGQGVTISDYNPLSPERASDATQFEGMGAPYSDYEVIYVSMFDLRSYFPLLGLGVRILASLLM